MTIIQAIKELRPSWHANPPVEGFEVFDAIESHINAPLPADYKYFYQWFSNGGEAVLPGGYLLLFPAQEVLTRQRTYRLEQLAPWSVVIGMEGDDIFCFDLRSNKETSSYGVIRRDYSSIDENDFETVAENFCAFLVKLLGK